MGYQDDNLEKFWDDAAAEERGAANKQSSPFQPSQKPLRAKDMPHDANILHGVFVRTEQWGFSAKPSIPAVIAIFKTSGVELGMIMPERAANLLQPGEETHLIYRRPKKAESLSALSSEFDMAMAYHQPPIVGDFYGYAYGGPQGADKVHPLTVWKREV